MTLRLFVVLAGLCGAAGVALSAVAAHYPGGANLTAAADFLLFHAPVFLALAVFARLEILSRWVLAAAGLVLFTGLVLFSGDLASRVFFGARLFHWAAPLGGSILIFGWIFIGLSGIFARR